MSAYGNCGIESTKLFKRIMCNIPSQRSNHIINKGTQKEQSITDDRLEKYSENLVNIIPMFENEFYRIKGNGIRYIQLMVCSQFDVKTDRAAWRNTRGKLAWFCQVWSINGIPEFVQNLINWLITDGGIYRKHIIFHNKKRNQQKYVLPQPTTCMPPFGTINMPFQPTTYMPPFGTVYMPPQPATYILPQAMAYMPPQAITYISPQPTTYTAPQAAINAFTNVTTNLPTQEIPCMTTQERTNENEYENSDESDKITPSNPMSFSTIESLEESNDMETFEQILNDDFKLSTDEYNFFWDGESDFY